MFLQETIDLCVDISYQSKPTIDGLTMENFHKLLTITMPESLVLFDGKYCQQIDGVAMDSPQGLF